MAGKPRASVRASAGAGESMVVVDASELKALIVRLKDVENKRIKAAIRKSLKDSAKPAVDSVKAKVLEGGDSGKGRISHYRKVKIRSTTNRLAIVDGKATKVRETTVRESIRRDRMSSRQAIAKGVSASLTQSANGATVRIVASPRFLRARKGFLKAYNLRSFRHPTFGNRNEWREQQGNPYFGEALVQHREAIIRRLRDAMDEATKNL